EVGHLQIAAYGHSLGGAVGIGFVELDEPVTAQTVTNGSWDIDVAGKINKATASLRPLFDPDMAKIRC
ncbi:MAG: hypothetical protein GY947_07990, partial [Rhodobacteraceae bacterium]|nr:hypothetical protein [Paracoccaceae bacterium]